MVKEKRILSYFIGWLIMGFIICFLGVTNVFAEEITPTTGFRTQVGSINVSNGDIAWNTSNIGQYNSPLYFTQGQEYYNFFTPEYIRLAVITDLDSRYTYKLSYRMNIYELNVSNWKVSDIDKNYNLLANDDIAIVKESKCSVVSTNVVNGTNGTTVEKDITCTFSLNYSTSNAWINAGYNCKECTLSGIESLGTVSNESYMYVTNPKLERFEDNSGVIIDQNQTIIDQNNKTNEELGNIKDQIQESNKETQEVIKEQFTSCHQSVNLATVNSGVNNTTITNILEPGIYTFSILANNYVGVNLRITNGSGDVLGSKQNATGRITMTFTLNESAKIYMNGYMVTSNVGNFASNTSEIQVEKGNKFTQYEKPGEEICSNKIDETNNKLDNLTGAITDSSSPNTGALENSAGWLPAGPLDSILNLPLTMLNSLTNSLGKTCSPLNLTLPYVNKQIQIPCLSAIFSQITGVNGLWTWVGTIASVLILYNYLLNLYAWVDRVLTLRAEFDEAMGADLANWGRL